MILIGAKIKELRNSYRFTQKELAELIGVTKSTIAAYENNSRTPSYEVLIKIATVFHVTTDTILLNRTNSILEVDGLTTEQIQVVKTMIDSFCKSNMLDEAFEKESFDHLMTVMKLKKAVDKMEPMIEQNSLSMASEIMLMMKK